MHLMRLIVSSFVLARSVYSFCPASIRRTSRRLLCTGAPNPSDGDAQEQMNLVRPITVDNPEMEVPSTAARPEDFIQRRDINQILTERAARFYDPKYVGIQREKCILVSVEIKLESRQQANRKNVEFSHMESLSELSELVGTAGLQVMGSVVQKLSTQNTKTYVGPGKVPDIMRLVNETGANTLVIDDDLNPKQQRNLEDLFVANGGAEVKILDRTAIILEIFAQHAKSREGQLQVELAMLEYRLTRGPSSTGDVGRDSGAGFRGPGESKLETDKRLIKDKILLVKDSLVALKQQREHHRESRKRLGLPVVALVGYTNAGKSTLLNRLSRAGVLAENMLFATLDPTTRRVVLPKGKSPKKQEDDQQSEAGRHNKGQEVLLTDTVGFISKLPTDLIAAFRATLEEVQNADILIHVIDRSSPVWRKQRETVLKELDNIGCFETPIVELWNKVDTLPDADEVMLEAATIPIDVDAVVEDETVAVVSETTLVYDSAATSSLEGDEDSDEYAIISRDVDSLPELHTSPAQSSQKKSRNSLSSFRAQRKIFTVAASALTGVGFEDFMATLEDALSLLLRPMEVFIPYAKDEGLVTRIHSQGTVSEIEYKNAGTRIVCRVPDSLFMKLQPYKTQASS